MGISPKKEIEIPTERDRERGRGRSKASSKVLNKNYQYLLYKMTVPLESCFAENLRKGGAGEVRIEWMV